MYSDVDITFTLLKSALDGSTPELGSMDVSRWWSLFRRMQQNHVAALTYNATARCEVSRDVLMPWLSEREKGIDWHRYQSGVQKDIVDTMLRNGIRTLVLKGTHLAQYYPEPELREFGDLDLYFFDSHAEADRVAQRELKVTVNTEPHHHTRYNYRGVTVESHYDFFNNYYPGSNKPYNKMLASLAPSPTFDVLHFLRHAAIHFAAKGLNLRDLCDWVMIVTNGKDIDWNTVEREINHFGMAPFVATLDEITRTRLGIASPLHFCAPADAADHLIHDIFYSKPHPTAVGQYFHSRWKRRLAFGDSLPSQFLHKTLSHLSH